MADEGLLLQKHLDEAGYQFTTTPYAHFTALGQDIRCTFYTSGKLVLQGRGVEEFIEFKLEPAVGRLFDRPCVKKGDFEKKEDSGAHLVDHLPKIGQDEAGKGDLFGPLSVAAVYISEKERSKLKNLEIRDGKKIKDSLLRPLAVKIRMLCPHAQLLLAPPSYNERYNQCPNLNILLARAHAEVFRELSAKTDCSHALIDQFAYPGVLIKEFRQLGLPTHALVQRVRAESDLAVACASIIARDAFLNWLESTSHATGITLPKGAGSAAFEMAKAIFKERGSDALKELTKWHFRTIGQVVEL